MNLYYSFIIPVFNRPDEIKELLRSFTFLTFDRDFEIVIVEDGSSIPSEGIVSFFKDKLNISYYHKPNSGPGDSRNYGMQRAKGNYYIILDSDCILPPHYLTEVDNFLKVNYLDCFGGPDAAHHSFTNLQKAINYVMTSFLTTGGIRGKKIALQKFEPRSFNMGISKQAFEITGGFGKIHPGEDPDLSQRILKAGLRSGFIEGAYVFHKRRISWQKFYNQMRKFGLVRPILNTWHPQSAKITYWLPSLFVLYTCFSILLLFYGITYFFVFLIFYCGVVFIDASLQNKNILIGFLSVCALFVQFFGYGMAFMESTFFIRVLKENPQNRFPKLFFD